MPATNLSFAKIVATPTLTSWSQAYNAGGLFIVLSLTSLDETLQKELPSLGKQILSNIEAEFFGLEEKTFETIKAAVPKSLEELPLDVTISLNLAFSKDDALYAFIIGNGRITLKRDDKIGIILEVLTSEDRTLHSSSGYLASEDLLLIQTAQFAESVPANIIIEAFDNSLPNDIAETISPSVHESSEGGASAIVLSYKGITHNFEEEQEEDTLLLPLKKAEASDQETPSNTTPLLIHHTPQSELIEPSEDEQIQGESISITKRLGQLIPKKLVPNLQLSRQKKIILGVTLVLFGALILSIFLVRNTSQSSNQHKLFTQIYTSAKKDYADGEGLLSLNKSLALDDYKSAQKTLAGAHDKFKVGSDEAKQLASLSTQVDKRVEELSGTSSVAAKEVDANVAPALAPLQKDSSIVATTQDDTAVYTVSSKTISQVSTSSSSKDLVKNDSNWSNAKSLGVFSGNLYVLDPKNGLLKFVPAESSYAASTYFKGDGPDLSQAVSMAIDSSIYILFSDGSIQKYTRGTKDTFSISGLDKNFSSPVSLFTSSDVASVYVLDSANSRIVRLDKSGTFGSQFQADILKNATAFTVSKDEKTAYVLSSGKIYQLTL